MRKNRIISAILAITCMASLAAGCKPASPAASTTPQASASASATPASTNPSTWVSDKPVEISFYVEDRPDMPWSNDMPVIKELEERTNVKIKFELQPQGNNEKLGIVMASGQVPDIVNSTYSLLSPYISRGAFEPLNSYMEQMPNLKAQILDVPQYVKELTENDGKIYVLPNIGAISTSEVFFVRKDWLDKKNLQAPVTLDDWYNMLKTFKDSDPNGNGKADEVPFSVRNKRSNIIVFAQSWGIQEEFFVDNGQIKYGAIDPRMKEVLTWLNKLYEEGLIDPDYLLNDAAAWTARFTNELSGATHDWISRMATFNSSVQAVNPNAQFVPVLPPVGPAGKPQTIKQQTKLRIENGCAAVSVSSSKKQEVMKFFDYLFSEEGGMLMNFGIEGADYKLVNGDPIYTDKILKDAEKRTPGVVLGIIGANRDIPYVKDLRYELQCATPEVQDAINMYDPIIIPAYPTLKFTTDENDIIKTKYTEIRTYKDEMMDKFILGDESLDKFDAFVEQLKKMGIEDVIKVHQAAYDRFMK